MISFGFRTTATSRCSTTVVCGYGTGCGRTTSDRSGRCAITRTVRGFRGSVLPDQLKWAVNALFQVKDFANYASYEDLLQIRSLVEEKLYSVEDDSELASIIGEARREAAYIATFKDPTQVPDELWWSTTYIAVARAMVALGRFAAEIGEDV